MPVYGIMILGKPLDEKRYSAHWPRCWRRLAYTVCSPSQMLAGPGKSGCGWCWTQAAALWLIMMPEALTLLGIGLAVGVPSAYLLSRYVASQLFGVKSNDVWTAAMALTILVMVAVVAGFLPARRASAIDPIQALRYE